MTKLSKRLFDTLYNKASLTIWQLICGWGLMATPGFSSSDVALFSLNNTNFVVSISFIIFILILVYYKVPHKIITILDERAISIKTEIDDANHLLEEAKTILAQLEREHKENMAKAERILTDAEAIAQQILLDSKSEIKSAIARKIKLAEAQVEALEKSIVKEIKDRAIDVSFSIAEKELVTKVETKVSDRLFSDTLSGLGKNLKN